MKTESLETQILEKLNKILAQKNLELVCSESELSANSVFFRRIKKDFDLQDQNQRYGWDTLHSVFFASGTGSNMFVWTRMVLRLMMKYQEEFAELETYICKSFQDLGLMCLEGSASWEEILLKLNVLYPNV